ncbi:hypothetical protein [Lysobacter antibioticus]|uniref:hypothetical protein n=1 Tax=Lysobacter antibioticus TaxID=84531 RepID=UPI0004D017AC|nr:hypothetical protein [Lysobacter antibioticus]
MTTPEFRYRSPLARFVPDTPDLDRLKRQGWREQGLLVVSAEDTRLDWVERQLLSQIAERLYGKREKDRG